MHGHLKYSWLELFAHQEAASQEDSGAEALVEAKLVPAWLKW